jgi:CheY-like chemotaxis protein
LERALARGRVWLAIQEGEAVRLSLRLEGPLADITPGLSALRGVLESQGGRLLVVDQSLILELPAWRGAEVARKNQDTTVLVVDDDDIVLTMIDAVLRRAGFRVLLAHNGVQASALLRQHPEIDALVADAVLPGRSGLEVAEEARRQSLPVLMISGHDEQMLGISGVPLLQKPFGAKVLADAVEQMVVKG